MSDGPAVDAEEMLTGYFVIDVDSEESAIGWAARIPNARNGSVELRRVDEGGLAARMSAAVGNEPG